MKENDRLAALEPFAATSGKDREALSAIEGDLWAQVMAEPENTERHNAYFSFVTRNGLLKEGSRRYGAIVQAKDDYNVEARRQFRQYRKSIINLMFLTGPRNFEAKSRSSMELVAFVAAAHMLVFGLVMAFYKGLRIYGVLLFLAAAGGIIFAIYFKAQQVRNRVDAERRFL